MLTPSQIFIYIKGLNRLTYFPYQFERSNEYLEQLKGMKLNATVKISVVNMYDEMQRCYSKD